MKKTNKLTLFLVPVIAILLWIMFLPQNVKAEVIKCSQKDQTTNSVTLQWEEPSNPEKYFFGWGETTQEAKAMVEKKEDYCAAGFTTHTIKGLKPGTKYYVCINYRVSAGNYISPIVTDFEVYTLPSGKTTGLKCDSINQTIGQATISWKEQTGVSGYEYVVTDATGKKIKDTTENAGNTQVKIDINNKSFYTFKVRAFCDKTGKRVYGKWSDAKAFGAQPTIIKASGSKNGLSLTWSKLKDAKDYTVYVTRDIESGFQKITTTKNNKYTLKKYKGKSIDEYNTYYVYVIANKSVSGKIVKSYKNIYSEIKNNQITPHTFE